MIDKKLSDKPVHFEISMGKLFLKVSMLIINGKGNANFFSDVMLINT